MGAIRSGSSLSFDDQEVEVAEAPQDVWAETTIALGFICSKAQQSPKLFEGSFKVSSIAVAGAASEAIEKYLNSGHGFQRRPELVGQRPC